MNNQSDPITGIGHKRSRIQVFPKSIADLREECWLYAGPLYNRGYGFIPSDGIRYLAHRVMYEDSKGPIPLGLVIDHLCEQPCCINPDHLEAVTEKENFRRHNERFLGKTCRNGHERAKEESWHYDRVLDRYKRACKACNREYSYRKKVKVLANG